jgi:hypothetical protein
MAEHGLNFTHSQLDLTRDELDMRIHAMMHMENVIEM